MKPPKFHVGQAVVCLCKRWPGSDTAAAPRKGQICTVAKLHNDFGVWWLELEEFPPAPHSSVWSEDRFGPVVMADDAAVAELLAETLEPVTA